MPRTRRVLTLIGLSLTLIVPLLPLIPATADVLRVPGVEPRFGRELFWWAQVLLVLLYVRTVERRPLTSIGFRLPDRKTYLIGIAASIALVVGVGVVVGILLSALQMLPAAGTMQAMRDPPNLFGLAAAARAGVAEELFFRGYGIERLDELTGSRYLAAAITLILFTLAHLTLESFPLVLVAACAGSVLTVLYLWRRDLACNMIAHTLTDILGLLVG